MSQGTMAEGAVVAIKIMRAIAEAEEAHITMALVNKEEAEVTTEDPVAAIEVVEAQAEDIVMIIRRKKMIKMLTTRQAIL